MTRACGQRVVIGARPAQAPEGWTIFNAPRPLAGHREWIGDFVAGIFFVAVDPQGERAAWMAQHNAEQAATILTYVDEATAFARARALILAEEGQGDPAEVAILLETVDNPHNRNWILDYYCDNWRAADALASAAVA